MTACKSTHLFCEILPDGLALYPFGERQPVQLDWLDEEVVRRVGQLERPTVFLDLARVEYVSSAAIGAMLRLGKRAHNRGGRLVLCNAKPIIREVFDLLRLDKIPWLAVRDQPVPGRLRLPDPAWLSWNGGVVTALARTLAEERDYRLMPVLADALEEAGCELPDVLGHCRGPARHVAGCWVLRLLLGSP